MQRRECIDETFDATRCASYNLLAQASEEGFALAVVERLRKRFIAFVALPTQVCTPEDWSSATHYLQTAYPWVAQSFNSVALSYRSRKFTVVPTQLFDCSLAKSLLSAASSVDDLDEIHFCKPNEGITMVHALPTQLAFAWKSIHADSLLFHPDSAVIKSATRDKHPEAQLYLTLGSDFCTLIVTQNGKLLAAQPIDAHTATDVLYFCTATLHELFNGTPPEATIKLLGKMIAWPDTNSPNLKHQLKATEIALLLKRYYKVSNDPIVPEDFSYSYTVEKARNEASSLFLLAECV